MDVALVKYHVAAVQTPNSPQLWNNIGHHALSMRMAEALAGHVVPAFALLNCLVVHAGMCFFGKQKYVAAISCLKKASYLGGWCSCSAQRPATCSDKFTDSPRSRRIDKPGLSSGPFEWIVSYNLGLLHLATGQYASAFHHFSSSINIKSDFAHTYMYLAVALAKLDDVDNASAAYEKAIELDDDMMFRLNYGKL